MNKKELAISMQEYMDDRPIVPFEHENHANELYGAIVECAEKFKREILDVYDISVHDTTARDLTRLILYSTNVAVPSKPMRFKVSFLESVHVSFEVEADNLEQAEDEWREMEWFGLSKYGDGDGIQNGTVVVDGVEQ